MNPELSTRELANRRWIGRLVRVGLVLFAITIAGSWVGSKVSRKARHISMVNAPTIVDASLAPGDLRIYNRDSTVDLILRGTQVLAGLSPKTVEKIRTSVNENTSGRNSELGNLIASTVKSAVSGAIGMHAAYPVKDIDDLRYEDGQITLVMEDGSETRLFHDAKVNRERVDRTFSEADAERFIDAVRERKREIDDGTYVAPAIAPIPAIPAIPPAPETRVIVRPRP